MVANVCVCALNYLFNGDGLRKKYQVGSVVRNALKVEDIPFRLFIGLEEMRR